MSKALNARTDLVELDLRRGIKAIPVKAAPLHDRVASRVRSMIVDGTLQPGVRVSEKDLCQQFGISRTPLREALKVLASEELVALLPNRGATITEPTPDSLAEKFEIVALLEGLAARQACENATAAQVERLEAINQRMIGYFEAKDVARYFKANLEFHSAILASAGNRTLGDLHEVLSAHLRRARYQLKRAEQLGMIHIHEHRRLMAAIRKRDAGQAEELARSHMRSVARRVIAFVRANLENDLANKGGRRSAD